MRVFKTKWFARFARRARITDPMLRQAVREVQDGLRDADLGGGVIKQRLARSAEENPAASACCWLIAGIRVRFSSTALPRASGGDIGDGELETMRD